MNRIPSVDLADLTIVIPVKNEAPHLGECLERIGNFAQVLVVDSGSQDATLKIAEKMGAPFVHFNWNGHFPKKKNWVLQEGLVTTPWILFLDADEYLTEGFKSEVKQELKDTPHNAFWLNYDNFFLGRRIRHGIPFRKRFLLRNGKGMFQRVEDKKWTHLDMEVHEQLEVEGTVGIIRSPIIHQNYKGLSHFLAKHNDYSTWEARRYLSGAEVGNPSLRQRFKRALLDSYFLGPCYFFVNYFVRLGLLDGMAGFIYSLLKGVYFLEVKLKINEFRKEKFHQTESLKPQE